MSSCEHINTSCKDSRRTGEGWWRRRECLDCGDRFTTMEVALGNRKPMGKRLDEVLRIKYGGLNNDQKKAIQAMLYAFGQGD